jgi:large subunit ribosomal protein L33
MAKKGEARTRKSLKCTVCGELNYRTEKNDRNTTEKLELNKYCSRCKKATAHKETK